MTEQEAKERSARRRQCFSSRANASALGVPVVLSRFPRDDFGELVETLKAVAGFIEPSMACIDSFPFDAHATLPRDPAEIAS